MPQKRRNECLNRGIRWRQPRAPPFTLLRLEVWRPPAPPSRPSPRPGRESRVASRDVAASQDRPPPGARAGAGPWPHPGPHGPHGPYGPHGPRPSTAGVATRATWATATAARPTPVALSAELGVLNDFSSFDPFDPFEMCFPNTFKLYMCLCLEPNTAVYPVYVYAEPANAVLCATTSVLCEKTGAKLLGLLRSTWRVLENSTLRLAVRLLGSNQLNKSCQLPESQSESDSMNYHARGKLP